ncbi:MAG TPA: hypothetical protein VI689_01225 [Acidimicrobiia bacterium]|nr:hypothetical protein [Acidimicrobiia bacterium]
MIHWAPEVSDDWGEVLAALTRAFEATRAAAQAGDSIVYVVHNDDLLGRRGAGKAMVAAGLLSAARTAALEGIKDGWTVNVVAFSAGTDPETVADWADHLIESSDVTGEVLRIGPDHIGKALP